MPLRRAEIIAYVATPPGANSLAVTPPGPGASARAATPPCPHATAVALSRARTIANAGLCNVASTPALLLSFCLLPAAVGCSRQKDVGPQGSAAQPSDSPRASTPLPPDTRIDATALPTYDVMPLGPGESIQIDGRLDDAAWKSTAPTRDFVLPHNGRSTGTNAALGGNVRLRYDATQLYVAFDARDQRVRGGFDMASVDPHLWTRDTIELMLDPDGDGDNRDYYEIQVNPQGLVFDSQFDSYNQPRVLPDGPFGHQDFDSGIRRAVTILGSIDDDTDVDGGYVVELALPFSRLSKALRVPPPAGAEWRANFYVMQDNGGVSWSPILGQGNFHRASRFGRLRFR